MAMHSDMTVKQKEHLLRSCDRVFLQPTRCTNFTNLFWHEILTCFGQFLCPSPGVYSLCTQQWYMSYRFVDNFRAGPGWNCSKAVYKPL